MKQLGSRRFGLFLLLIVVVPLLLLGCTNQTADEAPATSLLAPTEAPISPPTPVVLDGERLFVTQCAKCHGLEGLGNGPSVGSLSAAGNMNLTILQDQSDEQIFDTISGGRGIEMPPWELVLSVEQRQALVKYVRTLANQ